MADAQSVPFRNVQSTARTSAPARFVALDALRGLAATMIVLFHCEIASHFSGWPLVRRSEVFVDFFFVLSGFVIATAYAGRINGKVDLARYAILRIGRVWPLHVAMLAAFVGMELVKAFVPALGAGGDPAFTGSNAPAYIVSNLFLVQALGFDGELSWNTPSWSISAEIAAYAVFAVLAFFFSGRRLVVAFALAALAAIALLALDGEGMATTARLGGVRAVLGFSVGAALAVMTRNAPRGGAPSPMAHVAEIAAALLVVATTMVPETDWRTYLSPFAFAVAVHVFAREEGMLSAWLRTRPMIVLGGLSYAIYMVHMFINLRLLNVASLSDRLFGTGLRVPSGHAGGLTAALDFGGPWAGDLATVALLGIVVAVAWLARKLVEDPGRRLARRLAARFG